jgi:hypothetical protein
MRPTEVAPLLKHTGRQPGSLKRIGEKKFFSKIFKTFAFKDWLVKMGQW